MTYDDGPDPATTPLFLNLLDSYRVSATFFLLGSYVKANASLVTEMAAAGHELAVHGWDHGCQVVKSPGRLDRELVRAKASIEDLTGSRVAWYRPPYGVLTVEGLLAARRVDLQTVLWSAWGRDWSRRATPQSIVDSVERVLEPGGTVLLHDTDRTSSTGSWRGTLSASQLLLERWTASGQKMCRLSEHLGVQAH